MTATYSLVLAAAGSILVALFLTPLFRNLAIHFGLLDHPDQHRKTHTHAVPRVGGIPIFIAYFASVAIVFFFPVRVGHFIPSHLNLVWKLFPAAALVFAVGLLDDIGGLKPWQKLAGQLAGAVTAFLAGVHLDSISGQHLNLWLALAVTVAWIVICTNAFNLIDGVDGLAAGVGLFATITTLIAALLKQNIPLAMATIPLAGALLGFLRYNFSSASVYLGDSGSMLIGFLLACYSIVWTGKASTMVGMTAPLMVLAIPLIDTGLAIARRYLRGQAIFGADRGHIHHRLLARGFTPRRVVLVLYATCGLCAFLSLMQSMFNERFGAAIIIFFCAGIWGGVRYLGYAEFDAARRIVFGGTLQKLLHGQLQLSTLGDSLAKATTPDECWNVLRRSYGDFGFNEIKLRFQGQSYAEASADYAPQKAWSIRIALSETDYINLSREFATAAPPIVAAFADSIGAQLRAKIAAAQDPRPIEVFQLAAAAGVGTARRTRVNGALLGPDQRDVFPVRAS